jgi:hypothetical protein
MLRIGSIAETDTETRSHGGVTIIQEMIDRKQAYFARSTRSIICFDVQKTGDRKYFIHVVSTLPLPAAGKD